MTSIKIVLVGAALLAATPVFAQSFERGSNGHPAGASPFTNVSSENALARYKAQVFYPVDEQVRRIDTLTMR